VIVDDLDVERIALAPPAAAEYPPTGGIISPFSGFYGQDVIPQTGRFPTGVPALQQHFELNGL
jgi:hypothetical protein